MKNIFSKKMTLMALAVLMVFAFNSNVALAFNSNATFAGHVEEFILPAEISTNLARFSDSGETLRITDRQILDEIVRLNNLTPPAENAELVEIVFAPFLREDFLQGEEFYEDLGSLSLARSAEQIRNVRARPARTHHFPHTERHGSFHNTGNTTGTHTVNISEQVSSTFSATVGVNASAVTAGVGFSVTETSTVSHSASINVPARTSSFINSSVYAHVVDFDIYQGTIFVPVQRVGSGTASRPDGIRFMSWLAPL